MKLLNKVSIPAMIVAGALAVVGCGGGGTGNQSLHGGTKVTIHWPARHGKVIPHQANSVKLVAYLDTVVVGSTEVAGAQYSVNGGTAVSGAGVATRLGGDFSNSASVSNITITNLPDTAGTDQIILEAQAYETPDGSGTSLAKGDVSIEIVAGHQTPFDLSMATTITSVRATMAAQPHHGIQVITEPDDGSGVNFNVELGQTPSVTFEGINGGGVVPWFSADLQLVSTTPVYLGGPTSTILSGVTTVNVGTINTQIGSVTLTCPGQADVVPAETFTVKTALPDAGTMVSFGAPNGDGGVADPLVINDIASNGANLYALFYDGSPSVTDGISAFAQIDPVGNAFTGGAHLLVGNPQFVDGTEDGRFALGQTGGVDQLFGGIATTKNVGLFAPGSWSKVAASNVVDVASASGGNLYALLTNHQVVRYNASNGTGLATVVGNTGSASLNGSLAVGRDMWTPANLVLYVALDSGAGANIKRFDASGVLDTNFHYVPGPTVTDVATDAGSFAGLFYGSDLYVLDATAKTITIYSWDGSQAGPPIDLSSLGATALQHLAVLNGEVFVSYETPSNTWMVAHVN